MSLTLEPVGWDLHYKAGQFITFVFETPRGEKRRSYSFSSCPELGEEPEITVRKIDNGEFSRPLNYNAAPGDLFLSSGVQGMFTLPEVPDRHDYVYLAAGSGITPCRPMIRLLLAAGRCRVTLIYSGRSEASTLFLEEFRRMQSDHADRFTLYVLFSDSEDLLTRRLSKWLLDQLLDRYVTSPEKTLFYLCGPFEYMQMCRIALFTRVSRSQVRSESFDHSPRLILPEPPDRSPNTVEVRIGKSAYTFMVTYPEPVTKAASRAGVALPYSCEAGRCGSCTATILAGKMWMAYNEVLTDKEVAAGRVLACQAFPVGGPAVISFG